ncbi:hypothetical protein LCGC14_0878610 [marine sediment metagenome]|uniref:Uncharacterized protein n=1 Tax=marine sediment metagenome TaxID=412755 RepID=A0A0F9P2K6_9ZZZZ
MQKRRRPIVDDPERVRHPPLVRDRPVLVRGPARDRVAVTVRAVRLVSLRPAPLCSVDRLAYVRGRIVVVVGRVRACDIDAVAGGALGLMRPPLNLRDYRVGRIHNSPVVVEDHRIGHSRIPRFRLMPISAGCHALAARRPSARFQIEHRVEQPRLVLVAHVVTDQASLPLVGLMEHTRPPIRVVLAALRADVLHQRTVQRWIAFLRHADQFQRRPHRLRDRHHRPARAHAQDLRHRRLAAARDASESYSHTVNLPPRSSRPPRVLVRTRQRQSANAPPSVPVCAA